MFGVMKFVVYVLTLVTSQCVACELASVDKLRRDVEAAFVSKSFAAVARTYRSRSPVELKLEVEMDDEHPDKTFTFSSLSKLST